MSVFAGVNLGWFSVSNSFCVCMFWFRIWFSVFMMLNVVSMRFSCIFWLIVLNSFWFVGSCWGVSRLIAFRMQSFIVVLRFG